jgi:hypothetical protein
MNFVADLLWLILPTVRHSSVGSFVALKFIEVRIFCYFMPVIGKNTISWFYAYVEQIEIKTKTVNIIHFPYLDLSQNVKIHDAKYAYLNEF